MNKELEEITRCLHQVFRSTLNMKTAEKGNCNKCTYDEKNKECLGYTPIKLYVVEVYK